MKTNKEFINGIYEKYDEHLKEKKKRKQIDIKRMVNMAAVVIILFSAIIVLSERKETQVPQTIVSNEGAKQDKVNLETVGNFENFYKVIKERYNSDSMLEGESELILEDSTTKAERDSETKNSKTNTQVNNVDEADIVQVDGNYIYYVSNKKLVIIDAHTPEASEKISEINYKDTNFNPREVYVKGQKIIVIGNEYDNSCKTEVISTEDVTATDIERVQESKPKSGMRIYDISNIKEPKETRRVMIEGNYISSRMIEDNIYYVANKYIATSNIQRNKMEDLDEDKYKPVYQDTAVSQEEKCINYDLIYYFPETQDSSYLMLAGLNINNNEEAEIRTFLGAGQYIYSSEKNMYIATNKTTYGKGYEVLGGTTHLLKIELNNGKFNFKAECNIDGQVNNQFSMDENKDTFRIATTTGNIWVDETTANNLYILNDKLEEIGRVENFGKEEKIYSVRYVENKAYVVTFKQTDPLFVIDLSESTKPQILGELKIPGYSTYLHPYDDTHLIGFGYDTKENGTRVITNGLKMSMFDISDFNNPQELFKISIGDSKYTYSELLYNHKALLFSKEKNIIAFPLYSSSGRKTNSRAAIYNIDLKKGFSLKGEISNVTNKYEENVKRIVFANDTFYTFSDSLVKVANMDTLEVVKEFTIKD